MGMILSMWHWARTQYVMTLDLKNWIAVDEKIEMRMKMSFGKEKWNFWEMKWNVMRWICCHLKFAERTWRNGFDAVVQQERHFQFAERTWMFGLRVHNTRWTDLANRLLSSMMQGGWDCVVWVAGWTDRANRLLSSVMHDNRGLERKGWYRQLKGGVNGPMTFEWCEIIDLVEIWRRMPKMGNWYETPFEKLIRVTVLRNWHETLFETL